ncbi:MAG: hypothetical protein QG670_804 [Thermoproteota archaeon]|nr:hypothetical protein [Thermoproteota archaeon]
MNQVAYNFPVLKPLGIEELSFGRNIIAAGPPGVGKSVLCDNLVIDCLAKGIHVIYITLDTAPKEIMGRLELLCSKESGKKERPSFIDGYSWLLGEVTEDNPVAHLSNLNNLGVRIFSTLNERASPHILLFDSISTLFIYNGENEITRFMQVNMARIKQSGSIGFWTVGEGMHTQTFSNLLRHLADGIIEMKFEEESELKRLIRVHTLKGYSVKTNWYQFMINNGGHLDIIDSPIAHKS